MQTHNPTTQMATAASVEADAEAVTRTGESPSTVLGVVNASSDTDASDHFFQEDAVYDTEASESSIYESPSASDSDARSATITPANRKVCPTPGSTCCSSEEPTTARQRLEQRDGLGSADTKIPSNSDVRSATITLVSRCGDGSYVFEACMISVAFLLVLSSPQLGHLYSEPLALLQTIAAFISAYIIILIFIFSPTMCLSTVFFHMPYPVLLAIAAERFVGPYAGFLVMHMATGWLAGLFGYAYAEHLQYIGRETTAKHITPPTFLTEEDERSFKIGRGAKAAAFGLLSLLMVMAGALPLWLFPMDVLFISVAFLSLMEGAAIFSWVAFVARFVLHDALLSEQQLGNIMLCYILPYVVTSFFVLLLSCSTGDTIGAKFLWCLMLSMAGLLGYELSVHAQCKQMMLSRKVCPTPGSTCCSSGEPTTARYSSDSCRREISLELAFPWNS